ncbi:MAG: hypothetical protein H7Y38_20125 [Armatimonadetes bacterium]|nr:hypothetical protein [Armatimonadota bacterium]
MEETSSDAAIREWVNALAPGLKDRVWDYLRELIAAPPVSKNALFTFQVREPELPASEALLRRDLRAKIAALPSADAPIPLPVVAMVGIFAAVVSLRFGLWAFAAVLLIASALGFWSYAQGVNRALARTVAYDVVIDRAIPDALYSVARTRHERAYADAVTGLLPTTATDYLSPELRREQMEQLAALLESSERLDAVRAEIATASASASPESLRAEADALRTRAERAADPATCAALEQSLALLSERSRRADAMTALAERIEAESELVYQAFRSAQSSIAALRVSPTVAGLNAEAQAGSVADVAETIRRQTQAVENAVQELGIRS